jgi:hypothetical protein
VKKRRSLLGDLALQWGRKKNECVMPFQRIVKRKVKMGKKGRIRSW